MDIEEMIADAKAEEEVATEREKAARQKKSTDNLKKDFICKELKDTLKNIVKELADNNEEQTVTISLDEYISLVFMARDLDILKKAIERALKLSYDNDYLTIYDGKEIVESFKTLFYEEYNDLFNLLTESEKGE